MPRALNKLNVKQVASLTEPGIYGDGGGLYLRVSPNTTRTRSWVYNYTLKRRREMVLGSPLTMTLAQARAARDAARALVEAGTDPIDARQEAAAAPKVAAAVAPTFGKIAVDLIDTLEAGWRNPKHRQQWRNTLATYCKPIWHKPVDEVTTDDMLAILKPLWLEKAETATRVRARAEKVLDAAKALGHRSGENPARYRGHLALMLPSQKHVQTKHHAAMPYDQVARFVRYLRHEHTTSVASQALEFLILCANRTSEVRLAEAREFDLEAGVWTIPASRMKMNVEHRVPLSAAALDLVRARMRGIADPASAALIFSGRSRDKPLSLMALAMLMRRSGFDDYTVHGFRSSFRDWVGEETAHPRDLAEMALAHAVGDEVERAYRRGDALEKRRVLMAEWADYVTRAEVAAAA